MFHSLSLFFPLFFFPFFSILFLSLLPSFLPSPSVAPRTQRSGERTVRHESSRALCSHRTQTSPPTSPTAALSVCPLCKVVWCAPSQTRQCDSCSGPRAQKTDTRTLSVADAHVNSFLPSFHSDTPQATRSTARRVSQECLTRVVCSRFSFRWLLLRPARFCAWPPLVLRSILARTDGVFRYVRLPRRVERSSSQDLFFEAELRGHLLEAACGTVVFSVHTPYCFIFFIFLSFSCPSLVCLL